MFSDKFQNQKNCRNPWPPNFSGRANILGRVGKYIITGDYEQAFRVMAVRASGAARFRGSIDPIPENGFLDIPNLAKKAELGRIKLVRKF